MLLVGVFAFLLYAATWHNGYVLNDTSRLIQGSPIVRFTFYIEHYFWGDAPSVSHWINGLLFGYTVTLIWALMFHLSGSKFYVFPTLTALLFAVHPLHTEAVCYVSHRGILLAFLFILLAAMKGVAYFHTRYLRYAIMSGLALVIVGFSVLWPLFDVVLFPLRHLALWDRIPTVIYILGRSLYLMVIPHPMLFNYGWQQLPLYTWQEGSLKICLSVVVYSGLFSSAFLLWRRCRWLCIGLFLFLVPTFLLGLYSFITGFGLSESLLYFSSFGVSWSLAWLIMALWTKCQTLEKPLWRYGFGLCLMWIVIAIFIIQIICTISRTFDWENEQHLLESSGPFMARNAVYHYRLGNYLLGMSSLDYAGREFLEATRLYPAYTDAYYQLGLLYERRHHLESARWAFKKCLYYGSPHRHEILLKLIVIQDTLGDIKDRDRYKLLL